MCTLDVDNRYRFSPAVKTTIIELDIQLNEKLFYHFNMIQSIYFRQEPFISFSHINIKTRTYITWSEHLLGYNMIDGKCISG